MDSMNEDYLKYITKNMTVNQIVNIIKISQIKNSTLLKASDPIAADFVIKDLSKKNPVVVNTLCNLIEEGKIQGYMHFWMYYNLIINAWNKKTPALSEENLDTTFDLVLRTIDVHNENPKVRVISKLLSHGMTYETCKELTDWLNSTPYLDMFLGDERAINELNIILRDGKYQSLCDNNSVVQDYLDLLHNKYLCIDLEMQRGQQTGEVKKLTL